MYGDYFEQYIPVKYRHDSLELRTYREMEFLGRENLQLLARFWKQHAEKRAKNAETAATYEERERADSDAREERALAKELNQIAAEAEPKPLLFEKPTFKTGSRVTCFLENPDRYVSGILAKVKTDPTDEDSTIEFDATLLIRAYDGNDQHTIEYVPDGFSLFMSDDFEYFKTHPRFFRLYLNYYTQTIPERDKVDRMIACLPPRHTPPDAA